MRYSALLLLLAAACSRTNGAFSSSYDGPFKKVQSLDGWSTVHTREFLSTCEEKSDSYWKGLGCECVARGFTGYFTYQQWQLHAFVGSHELETVQSACKDYLFDKKFPEEAAEMNKALAK